MITKDRVQVRFEENIKRLDLERYNILKSVADGDDSWICSEGSYYTFTVSEMAVPCKGNSDAKYILPDELINIFKSVESPEAKEQAKLNSEVYDLICGCILSYGLIDVPNLEEIVNRHLGYELTGAKFKEKLEDCEALLCTITVADQLVYSRCLDNPQYYIDEQDKVSDFDYKEFTREEIVNAADVGYIPDNPCYKSVRNLLNRHYKCAEDRINLCLATLINYAKACRMANEALAFIACSLGEFSEKFMEEFMPLYCEYNNCTGKWALKGYTPNEITRIKNPELIELMARNMAEYRTNRNEAPPMNEQRPGRFESCSCGSGRKYKDCCGRN